MQPPSIAKVLVHPSLDSPEHVEGTCDQRILIRMRGCAVWSEASLVARLIVGLVVCWLINYLQYFREGRSVQIVFASFLKRDLLLKERSGSKDFPLRVGPFSEEGWRAAKVIGSHALYRLHISSTTNRLFIYSILSTTKQQKGTPHPSTNQKKKKLYILSTTTKDCVYSSPKTRSRHIFSTANKWLYVFNTANKYSSYLYHCKQILITIQHHKQRLVIYSALQNRTSYIQQYKEWLFMCIALQAMTHFQHHNKDSSYCQHCKQGLDIFSTANKDSSYIQHCKQRLFVYSTPQRKILYIFSTANKDSWYILHHKQKLYIVAEP